MFFVWNTIGSGLNEYIKQAETFSLIELIFTKEIYLPIAMFLILLFLSFLIKKKYLSMFNFKKIYCSG